MQVEDMVEAMFKNFSETRNSSTILYCKLLNQFRHAGFTQEQIQIMLSIPFETVSRVARKFREQGKYLWDQVVQEERERLQEEMRQKYWPDGRKHLLEVMQRNKQKIEEANRLPF